MTEYTVYLTQTASAIAHVEAEDPGEAIDLAYEHLPGSLCHQCAREVDLAGEWEPVEVADSNGKTVWQEKA